MGTLVVVVVVVLIVLVMVFGHSIPIYKNHNRVTGGVINYDAAMRKFVYKIDASYPHLVELLTRKNAVDELTCTFNPDNGVLRFSEYGSYREYHYQILECNGFSILRLEDVSYIGMKSSVPFKLNPFIVDKLSAEVIPFSLYKF